MGKRRQTPKNKRNNSSQQFREIPDSVEVELLAIGENSNSVGYIAIGHWDLNSVAKKTNLKYRLTKGNKLGSDDFKRGAIIKIEDNSRLGNRYKITKSQQAEGVIAATYCLS